MLPVINYMKYWRNVNNYPTKSVCRFAKNVSVLQQMIQFTTQKITSWYTTVSCSFRYSSLLFISLTCLKRLHMWLRLQNFQIRIIIIHLIFGFSSYLIRKERIVFFYNLFYTAHLTFFNRVWLKIMGCLSVFRRVDKK